MKKQRIYGEEYLKSLLPAGDGNGILLCNYRMDLTPREYAILSLLLEREMPTGRRELADSLGVKETSIPVHVSNINKKARAVTGRRLILGNRNGEYVISESI